MVLVRSLHKKSKRELIERFIEKHSLSTSSDDIDDEFERYLNEERKRQLERICNENNLHFDKVDDLVSEMLYYGVVPSVRDKMISTFVSPPTLLQRDAAINTLTEKLDDFIETFYEIEAA